MPTDECTCPQCQRKDDLPKMRVFNTGATRDIDETKLDFDGFLSPYALERFAEYMNKNRVTADGLRDSDNWQRGIPLAAYRKSSWRHFFAFWKLARVTNASPDIEENLCALLFNVQGYLHEIVKARTGASNGG